MTSFRADWIDADEALARILARITTLGTEAVPLEASDGRVLAETVHSPIDQPAWDNSGMDGYAVRAEDIEGASPDEPRVLQMIEDVPAGSFAALRVEPGTAIRIMTGAPVPDGADSVVRLEHTRRDGERILVLHADDAHRNIRPRGEDIRRGDVAVEAGRYLRAAEIGVLAMVGAAHVQVVRRPVVGILSTGDEIVELDAFDEVLAGRRIANSNGPMLAAAVRAAGAVPVMLGVAADHLDALEARIDEALDKNVDMLVISAGASMGEHDLVKRALDLRGFELAFWRARVRPGSPLAFGTIPRDNAAPVAIFNLPGNPVSAFVTCELFVKPALRRMQGRKAHLPRLVTVRLAERVRSNPGLARFLRVRLEAPDADGLPRARLTGPQGSGVLTSAARADALLIVPEDIEIMEAGSSARAVLLAASDDAQQDGSYVN